MEYLDMIKDINILIKFLLDYPYIICILSLVILYLLQIRKEAVILDKNLADEIIACYECGKTHYRAVIDEEETLKIVCANCGAYMLKLNKGSYKEEK